MAVVPSSTDAVIQSAVDGYLASGRISGATTTIANTTASGMPDSVTVSYDYTYQVFGKAMKLLSGGAVANSVTLSSTSVMRNE